MVFLSFLANSKAAHIFCDLHGWRNKVKRKNTLLCSERVLTLGTYVIQPEREFHLHKGPTCETVASLRETVIHSLLESYVFY